MSEFFQNFITYCNQVCSGLAQVKNFRLSHLGKVFSLMGRREKIALFALAVLAVANFGLSLKNFFDSHSTALPALGGNLTEGLLGQPGYINPLLAHQDPDLSLTKLVFSGLYKYDNGGLLAPDLALDLPEISTDQKQYTVHLKKNVKWHNGKTFNADDVIFTLQILRDPTYKSPLGGMWQSTTVEKIDEYTVKFSTRDISGPFVHNLTLPIISKAVWSRTDPQNFLLSESNLKAVGTGPYAIKEIKKQASGKIEQITLASFQDFYGLRPKISTVVLRFYDSENDILNALHSREIGGYGFVSLGGTALAQDQSSLQIFKLPLPQYQVIFFNLNNKILADNSVRHALNLATDRNKIITDVFKNQGLLPTSPLLPGQDLGKNPQNPPANAAAAAKLLESAGWAIDAKTSFRTKKNQVFELNLVTNDSSLNAKAADSLAKQWTEMGIKINVIIIPNKELTDSVIKPRKFDILLVPLKFNADPDPFVFWHSSQIKDPGFNLSGFSDPAADKLISEARTTTNQDIRDQKYLELNNLIAELLPAIFLDQAVYIYALDKNIKGVGLKNLYEPNQRFYDIANWYIAEKKVWKK